MPIQPKFPAPSDVHIYLDLLRERSQQQDPSVEYHRLDHEAMKAVKDEVHDEVPEYRKKFKPAILLRAFVMPADEAHPMTIFGIEELRDVVLFAATPSLIDAGLASMDPTTYAITVTAAPGDRFTWFGGIVYEVLEWRKARTYANTDIALEWQANAERYRPQADEFHQPPKDGG